MDVNKYTDQQKIDFFNSNWKFIDRIFNVLQSKKHNEIRMGTFLLEWLADWLEKETENE